MNGDETVRFRIATTEDSPVLAELNQHLIQDEGHRNRMTLPELESRMRGWLQDEYEAILFEVGGEIAGYALNRFESDHVYLRQLFVIASRRREKIGSKAVRWLIDNRFRVRAKIRLDVLVGNTAAIQFWRAAGFSDYCITMEMDTASPGVH